MSTQKNYINVQYLYHNIFKGKRQIKYLCSWKLKFVLKVFKHFITSHSWCWESARFIWAINRRSSSPLHGKARIWTSIKDNWYVITRYKINFWWTKTSHFNIKYDLLETGLRLRQRVFGMAAMPFPCNSILLIQGA